jgi:hypothetical protein
MGETFACAPLAALALSRAERLPERSAGALVLAGRWRGEEVELHWGGGD